MISLVQMRQSCECGCVKNDEIFNFHFWCESLSQHSPPLARRQSHSLFFSIQTIKQEEKKSLKNDQTLQQIVSYRLGLGTQNVPKEKQKLRFKTWNLNIKEIRYTAKSKPIHRKIKE